MTPYLTLHYTHKGRWPLHVAKLFTALQQPCDLKKTVMSSLLPELHHSTGEVPGVCDGVVGVAAVCVPGIATSLPWQILKIKEEGKEEEEEEEKITQTALFTWTTLPPPSPILCGCRAAKTMILIRDIVISCFSQRSECLIAKCIYQYLV